MSRAALEVERAVKEMRAKAAKEGRGDKGRKANKEAEVAESGNETPGQGNQLTGDSNSDMTVDTDLSGQEDGTAGSNDAAEPNGKPTKEGKSPVAKKKNGNGTKKAAKAPKAPKAPKTPKAPKAAGERKPREKKLASGRLKKVEATGNTYLTLEFEEGKIVLTPTGNREQNRDIAVKALRALL